MERRVLPVEVLARMRAVTAEVGQVGAVRAGSASQVVAAVWRVCEVGERGWRDWREGEGGVGGRFPWGGIGVWSSSFSGRVLFGGGCCVWWLVMGRY